MTELEPLEVCVECGNDDAVPGWPICRDCFWNVPVADGEA